MSYGVYPRVGVRWVVHMGKENNGSDLISSIVIPIGTFISIFKIFGVKFSFSSLTSKRRELDRFRPCFHAYWYLTNYWNQKVHFPLQFIKHSNNYFFQHHGKTKANSKSEKEGTEGQSSRGRPHWPSTFHYRSARRGCS